MSNELPAWAKSVDCETAVLSMQIMGDFFGDMKIDDDRYVVEVIRDLCEIFQEKHAGGSDYWADDDHCFEHEMECLCEDVRKALDAEPEWINKLFFASYGDEHLSHLLQRHFRDKYARVKRCPKCRGKKLTIICVAKAQAYSTGPLKASDICFDEGSTCGCDACGYAGLFKEF